MPVVLRVGPYAFLFFSNEITSRPISMWNAMNIWQNFGSIQLEMLPITASGTTNLTSY
jgi:hypothetical protein